VSVLHMVANVVLWTVAVVLAIYSAFAYLEYTSAESAIDEICSSNDADRLELARLEVEVAESRRRVEGLLEKERQLVRRTEELKVQALELEREWEVVKSYKHRLEGAQKEIDEIRRRIRGAGK